MFMYFRQTTGQNKYINVDNKSFVNVAKFKYCNLYSLEPSIHTADITTYINMSIQVCSCFRFFYMKKTELMMFVCIDGSKEYKLSYTTTGHDHINQMLYF
jgi:hypothetical protein